MISLEQVRLLDLRVTKAVEYIKKLTGENTNLRGKIDSYQKRIDDLEKLIRKFKEDQNRIEDGILSALDRLNQFEDALENTISSDQAKPKAASAAKMKIEIQPEVKDEPAPAVFPEEAGDLEDAGDESSGAENELDIF